MIRAVVFLCLLIFLYTTSAAQQLQVTRLSCDGRTNPAGIERTAPGFSWQLQSDNRDVWQTAYRVLVADDSALLHKDRGNLWDSKKVESATSLHVPYKGKKLQPARTYYWKVMVWDNKKQQSNWSSIASFQTGLFTTADWKGAKWIALETLPDSLVMVPAEHSRGDKKYWHIKNTLPLLRKSFVLQKSIAQATLFICGLGHFEVHLNGRKVGDHFLDPGWTKYDKEALYVPFDVTRYLQQGNNAMGVLLGNGFYFIPRERYRKLTGAFGFPKMIARLHIRYKDGTTAEVISDESWKAAASPITFSSIYGGEDYNANLEQPGWDAPDFDDAQWQGAAITQGPPVLKAQQAAPLKVMQSFTAKKITRISDSSYVFDFGQNASGIPRITVRGKKGDTVRIIPAELLKEDGTANQRATGSPVYFEYVLKGNDVESWQPAFSYYGFRYLEVQGAAYGHNAGESGLPEILGLQALHTRNAAATAGSFTCSDTLFNNIFHLINWGIRSNMASVLTDCPHREKLGWLEQTHLMGNSIRYNYDVQHLFRKILNDLKTAQAPNGALPEFVPEFVVMDFMDGIFRESPEWGSAAIILPWYLYQWYGDKTVLQENYEMMQRYLAYLQSRAPDHILAFGLGDWYDLGPAKPGLAQLTPMGITATAIYYYDITIMSKVSRLLGKLKEAATYDALGIQVKEAFNKKFFNPETHQYGTGSQTANAMALYMNLVEDAYRKEVVNNLVNGLKENNYALTAGDIGFRYLLRVLEQVGRHDVIYAMNNRIDVPGYGYQLAKGATALTESWQALPSVSNNHMMLGHLMEWLYSGLAGIRPAPESVAFNRVEIMPEPVGDIREAAAHYDGPYGRIVSRWKRTGNQFELYVEIPPNTGAVVYLPRRVTANILESGRAVQADYFKNGRPGVRIGSGNYLFTVTVAGDSF